MEKKNVLLTIAYDGTRFAGWQRQPAKRTVQGELERVLSELCCTEIHINGTSRTDAGVHALGQRASFCTEFGIPEERLPLAANNMLAGSRLAGTGDIRILKAERVPIGFHARFDARGKKYIYRIRCAETPDVFLRNYRYQITEQLDLDAMREAAKYIEGTHDFKCFQAAGGEEKETTVRTIHGIEIYETALAESKAKVSERQTAAAGCESGAGGSTKCEVGTSENTKNENRTSRNAECSLAAAGRSTEREIAIAVRGDGFLYNMVRIITGTLVEVGLGKRKPSSLADIIASGSRQNAGCTAPPQGLYLAEVYYNEQDLKGGMEK